MEKKKPVKRPKMEIQIKRMWWDWYRTEGEPSMNKYMRKNFDKYLKVN